MTKSTTIDIDLEIYRLIENNRQSFNETQNEILRHLLGLGPSAKSIDDSGGINLGYGVFLPNGSKLRKIYKGTESIAEVKGSYIWIKGRNIPQLRLQLLP